MQRASADEAWVPAFRDLLLDWGESGIRTYPWRYKDDPYAVIVAEFMLHRTQTVQVVPVYERFVSAWPTLAALASADRSEAETALVSLGLQWRITGMLDAFCELWSRYGRVPLDAAALKLVKGIGDYIAGATVCFSSNRPATLIDTNTVRVVGRVKGLDLRGEARRRRDVIRAIEGACDPMRPRDFYYSLIDLSHTICRPKQPACEKCPLADVPCRFAVHAG